MAQEQAVNNFYDFMYGKFLLKRRFGITIHDDDYVEDAYGIYRDIGNIATAMHAFEFTVDESQEVVLPCNTEFVEVVSEGQSWRHEENHNFIQVNQLPPINPYSYVANAQILNNVSNQELNRGRTQLHPDGNYMVYTLKGTTGSLKLRFDKKYVGRTGVCIYRGMCIDENGNPLLSRKEAEAIAWKMAYYDVLKRSFQKDPGAGQMLQKIEMDAGKKMAAAKIPEYLTQNQLNKFLSAQTRHDRKVWWSDYKTIQ